jgi:tetratricopeptide (TPR) repeat protein
MRKLIWLSILAVLLAACNSAAPTPPPMATNTLSASETMPTMATMPVQPSPTPDVDVSAEVKALQAGDTAAAIDGLNKILANNPASAAAHLLLGQAYYRADQKDAAYDQFLAAFTLDPAASLPLASQLDDEWLKIGNAHSTLGQLDEALAAYQTVLKIKPDKAAAYTNIGVVYYQGRKFDEAVRQLQKALELDPADAETHYMLGAAYVQQEKLDEAEKSFNTAIELKPDLAAAYTGLGNVQLVRKDYAAAVKTLQKAAELQPDQSEAWLALGQAYALQGNTTEASAALKKCLEITPPGDLRASCEETLKKLGAP